MVARFFILFYTAQWNFNDRLLAYETFDSLPNRFAKTLTAWLEPLKWFQYGVSKVILRGTNLNSTIAYLRFCNAMQKLRSYLSDAFCSLV